MRTLAVLGAVVGGVGLMVTDRVDLPPAVLWTAFAVLALTAAILGLRLVGDGPWWLRGIVTLGSSALAAAVWAGVEAEVGPSPLRLVAGVAIAAVALLVGAGLVVRRLRLRRPRDVRVPAPRRAASQPARHNRRRGAHTR